MSIIIALSTPIGRGAIAVVRMSGNGCIELAKKVFAPFPVQPSMLKYGELALPEFTEHCMCVYFTHPRSYTGEDMVEFHLHGGNAIATAAINKCLSLGAVMAVNGEFSKRAFINGKQNLSNAEGIIEMIDAETAREAKAGADLLSNKLGKLTLEMQDKLTDMNAQLEVALDYPEEDLDLPTAAQVKIGLTKVLKDLDLLLDTVTIGKIVKYGVNVAIVGQTNVGKSSLLNALLGSDRAIVTDIEGTTRDTLSESIVYRELKINFVDTAGIRETADRVEKLGIDRARRAIDQADVVLSLVDNDHQKLEFHDKKTIIVYNKCDISQPNAKCGNVDISISAKTGENVQSLKQMIFDMFVDGSVDNSSLILTNSRHVDCLSRARTSINNAINAVDSNTLDCVAVELNAAWAALGEITGTTANEEIINRIYEKFCLGK